MVNLENKVIKARKLPDVKQKVGRVLSGASESKPSQSRERRNSRPAASFLGGGVVFVRIRGGGVPYSTSNYLDLLRGTAKRMAN